MKCSFCKRPFRAKEERLLVNVAKEHAHEAPSGTFHSGVDKNCFPNAVAAHRGVQSKPSSS